ncbi:NADPH-dependent FMN reductase, partial [Pulveribacter sp.]|uniref:NADPH-dependent FMN reductase n=1 Tax=Pulveribacter sp. TaxID=2678893 RepID=UPI0039174703
LLGGLRSQSHLAPLLINLGCWLAPRHHALGQAASAFGEDGRLLDAGQQARVQAVVQQVLWAAERLQHAD